MKKTFTLALALLLAGCGIDPLDGDFGIVAVKPERDTCWVKVTKRDPATGKIKTVNYEPRLCDGEGHQVEVLGRPWP